jgi:hypothetical protein
LLALLANVKLSKVCEAEYEQAGYLQQGRPRYLALMPARRTASETRPARATGNHCLIKLPMSSITRGQTL